MPLPFARPRGMSKATPLMIAFTLLAALGFWIMADLHKKAPLIERDLEAKRIEDERLKGVVSTPPAAPVAAPAPAVELAPVSFVCRWAPTPVNIDGSGADPVWQNAQSIDNFALPWLGSGHPAKSRTQARLLWDDQYLYFLAVMEDADLYADNNDHNGMLWFNDVFELFFKPSANNLGYYEFEISPKNTTFELFFPSRGSGGYGRWKNKFPFHLESKVSLLGTLNNALDRDEGWTVEGRIPWKDFSPTGGKPAPGMDWKMALCRWDYSAYYDHPETSTCAPLKANEFHQYEDYCTLKFEGARK